MSRKRFATLIALITALALVAAACAGDEEEEVAPPEEEVEEEVTGPQPGGTFRTAMEDFGFTCGFDPTCDFISTVFMWQPTTLVRTLITYPHVAGEAGGELVPDLATDFPEVSDDGLTYTFTLKDGIMFGPPVSREITSQDVAYALQRMATRSQAAQYAFYYEGIIDGFEVQRGAAGDIEIAGIETPDDKTIVFNLTAPDSQFLFRMAMPATGPIPEEVAGCFTKAGDYGRYVISSGPYMLEGSENLDITSCETMEPISGLDPTRLLRLVRNPDYDPATDSTEVRSNFPDAFEVQINTNPQDIFDKVQAGELEAAFSTTPPEILREFADDRETLPFYPLDVTWYITMNLTQPPFDDLAVRKAVNYVIDKDSLLRAVGGPSRGLVATHILPPGMAGIGQEYDPYPSEGFAGDVEAAKAEMAQSKYDTDGDGLCDAPECEGVLHMSRNIDPWPEYNPIIEANLAEIGITVTTRELETGASYGAIQTTARNVPISTTPGWGKDWADALTYMGSLFDSASIIPEGNVNYSLVGVTAAQNDEDGLGLTGNLEGVPNVDDDIAACDGLPLGQERIDCWNELDAKVMEEVVPWVPYRWDQDAILVGPAVTQFEFDQFAGEMSFAHVAVDPALQSGV